MASSSFLSENQSFSEANSSWASLVIEQVQNSVDDEDYSTILEPEPDASGRNTSVETHGRSKQAVDTRMFEQVLQVLVQQGAALDSLHRELDELRRERRQELEYRDSRLRLAEKELRSLRADKEKSLEALNVLSAKYATLKATDLEPESSNLPMDEHNRILQRIKYDARARIENIEAEKSYLTLQLSRLQIQVAQLKNQVDDRSYPEEVVEELTKTLQHAILEAFLNADVEASEMKRALAATQEHLSRSEKELDLATNNRKTMEERLEELQKAYDELHTEHDAVQERLAILESTQGQFDDAALKEAEEQAEQFQAKLSDIESARDAALLDCEQLRTSLREAEQLRLTLTIETETAKNSVLQAEEQAAQLQGERDLAIAEVEQLRSLEADLTVAREQIIESKAAVDEKISQAKAQQDQIDMLEGALKEARRGRSEALREAERLRLSYAEAEGSKAEADMINEESQQKLSELEEKVKMMAFLEEKLQQAEAQLNLETDAVTKLKDQVKDNISETAQYKTEIAELRLENEQLVAARRQMAAIYGLPTELLSSPRRTPTNIDLSVAVGRNSLSLSPSTSSVSPRIAEHPGPPPKRRRITRSIARAAASLGSSPISAIPLDDMEEHIIVPRSSPPVREQNSTNEDIPKHVMDIYVAFSNLASWHDSADRPICGFCTLYNHYHESGRRPPLNFDPFVYPITYWNHCLVGHKDALRPDIEAWLGTEKSKDEATDPELFQSDNLPALLATIVSWKRAEAAHVCGLCRIEHGPAHHQLLDFDPSGDPTAFLTHCHQNHPQFWKTDG